MRCLKRHEFIWLTSCKYIRYTILNKLVLNDHKAYIYLMLIRIKILLETAKCRMHRKSIAVRNCDIINAIRCIRSWCPTKKNSCHWPSRWIWFSLLVTITIMMSHQSIIRWRDITHHSTIMSVLTSNRSAIGWMNIAVRSYLTRIKAELLSCPPNR